MRLELETRDLDSIAEKVTERLFDRMKPYLERNASGGSAAVKLLSVKKAALVMGRGQWAIRQMIREGRLPSIKDGRRVMIEKDVIDCWIAAKKAETIQADNQ